MGILDKLMFWKKGDILKDLDKSPLPDMNAGLEPNLGMQGFGQQNFGQQPSQQSMQPSNYPSFQQSPGYGPQPQAFQSMNQEQQSYAISKEMAVISSKLDALRVAIDNLSQRLANLERIAYDEQQPQQPVYRQMPQRPY